MAAKRGLSIKKLAAKADVDYKTLHNLKTKKQQGITFAVLSRLCKALECTPNDLLVEVEDSNSDAQ
jgi:putative transcriptional regulator